MDPLNLLSTVVLFFNGAIVMALLLFGWKRRQVPAAISFLAVVGSIFVWVGGMILAALSPTAETAAFWALKIRFIGVAVLPVAFLAFVSDYTGRSRRLTRRRLALLLLTPAVTMLIIWFRPAFFAPEIVYFRDGPFMVEGDSVFGAWFWVHTVYSYLVLLAGFVVISRHALRSSGHFRGQAVIIFSGALFSFVANVVAIGSWINFPNLTVTSFTLGAVIWAWALFRYRLLDIMPIARDLIFESMHDLAFVLDMQDRLVDVNPAALQLIGRSENEIIGRPVGQIFANQPGLVREYAAVHEAQDEISVPVGGEQRVFDLRISPIRRRGRLNGRLVVMRDITEQRQLIDELNAYAHTVAHDLKSPLSVVLGYAQLLDQVSGDELDPQTLEWIQAISRTGQKMEHIVNELLLLASVRRLEQVDIAPLEMGRIVESVLTRLEGEIAGLGAAIQRPDDWPVAQGYAPWVEEIWANFLSNALKYGGSPPEVELGADSGPDGVRYWVRDNGPGLNEAEQEGLFTEFSRLERHEKFEGQGLGLSIAYRIARKLGGKVGVESTPGQGSLFFFTLPR